MEIEDTLKMEEIKDSVVDLSKELKTSAVAFLEECLVSGISRENVIRIMRIEEKEIMTDIIQIHLGAVEGEWLECVLSLAEKYNTKEHRLYLKDLIKVIKSIAVENKHSFDDYRTFLDDKMCVTNDEVINIRKLMSIRNSLERSKVTSEDLLSMQQQMATDYKDIVSNLTQNEELKKQLELISEENQRLKKQLEYNTKTKAFFKLNKEVTKEDIVDKMLELGWDVSKINVVREALEKGIGERQVMTIILRDPRIEYLEALVDVILASKRKKEGE